MKPRTFARFLISLPAIQAHLMFGVLIVIFAATLIDGNGVKDAAPGLVFCIVAYPVYLGLLWFRYVHEGGIVVVRDALERDEPPADSDENAADSPDAPASGLPRGLVRS